MKRFVSVAAVSASLFATSALAHSAHHGAEEAKKGLTLSGFHNFVASHLDQDIDRDQRDVKFANDTEVQLQYRGTAEQGFDYGAVIELEADVTEDFEEQGLNADKTYLFVESDSLGRVELGANTDAGTLLGVNASTIARATGGIHGDWYTVVSFPGDPHSGHSHGGSLAHLGHEDFIHGDDLPLHQQHGATEDANKITYITPRLAGFQGGVSFIPDTGNVGTAAGFTDDAGHRDFENVLSGGVNYSNRVGELSYIASLTGQYGNEEAPGHNDLNAYAAGLNVSYQGFTVAGSYGDWNKSFTHASPTTQDSNYWSAGAAYETGALGVSLTYLDSEREQNDLNVVSLGADYEVAPGLVPFAEVTFAEFDADDATLQDNDATAVLVGTLFSF
jgi:hypothetical protein